MEEHRKIIKPNRSRKFRFNATSFLKSRYYWILVITGMSFILSAGLSFLSSNILERSGFTVAFIVVLIIVLVNILFDTIGISVTAANEAPFHAMASRKLYGARMAIKLIKNAEKVSSFCNDVVGDICGVISGAASAYIIISLVGDSKGFYETLYSVCIAGLVACVTVGGKALGKTLAIRNSNFIVYRVAFVLSVLLDRNHR